MKKEEYEKLTRIVVRELVDAGIPTYLTQEAREAVVILVADFLLSLDAIATGCNTTR
jgi:hypothetical protein